MDSIQKKIYQKKNKKKFRKRRVLNQLMQPVFPLCKSRVPQQRSQNYHFISVIRFDELELAEKTFHGCVVCRNRQQDRYTNGQIRKIFIGPSLMFRTLYQNSGTSSYGPVRNKKFISQSKSVYSWKHISSYVEHPIKSGSIRAIGRHSLSA